MPAMMMAGATALQAGGSVFSGIMGSNAEKKRQEGIKKQIEALREARVDAKGTAQKYVDRAQGWLRPFRDLGDDAGNIIGDLFSGKRNMDDLLKQSSLFKFQQETGSRDLNRQLKARGLYGSGAGLETLSRFENQLLGEEGERTFGRLLQTTQLGAQAGAQLANGEFQTGNNLAGMIMNNGAQIGAAEAGIGQSRAAGTMSMATGITGGLDAVANGGMNFMNYQMYKPILDKLGGVGASNPMADNGMMQEAMGRGIVAGSSIPLGADAGMLEGVSWTSNYN